MNHPIVSLTAFVLALVTVATADGEEKLACPMGREYFLYTPDGIEAKPAATRPPGKPKAGAAKGSADDAQAARTYWLVVGIHGYGGNGAGAAGLAEWTKKDDVIVVGPTFPNGYQMLDLETDMQLIGIFTHLSQRFRLHPKMFVFGFSGGSQFAHRFALKHPDLVLGCSAHSGGTWGGEVNPAAVGIPFAVSCGEEDTEQSSPQSPMGRLDWFKDFAGGLNSGPFTFKARSWPGVGHGLSAGALQMTEDCFALATTGMHPPQLQEAQAEIDAIVGEIGAGRLDEAKRRIRALGKWAPQASADGEAGGGTKLTGVDEDVFGWRMAPVGKKAVEATRKRFLERAAADLSVRVKAAASGRPGG